MVLSVSEAFFQNPRIISFPEPALDFFKQGGENIQSPIAGLQEYGPYDNNAGIRNFSRIELIICCPDEDSIKTKTEKLCNYLSEGIRYSKGMKTDYSLDEFEINDQYYYYDLDDQSSLKSSLLALIRENRSRRNQPICVITVGSDRRGTSDTEDYYTTKKILISNGFSSQYISTQNSLNDIIQRRNEFVLRNIANNIYTKLGGIPWTLKYQERTKDQQLVMGYAFGRVKYRGSKKYVPCAVSFFNQYGQWLGIYTTTIDNPVIPRHSKGMVLTYDQAANLLEEALEKYATLRNFHNLKSLNIYRLGNYGREECKAFHESQLPSSCDELGLVSVSTKSSIRGYSPKNKHGHPSRGTGILFSETSSLLFTTGNAVVDGKEKNHTVGCPSPVVVQDCGKDPSSDKIEKIMNQTFDLTSLHWQDLWRSQFRLPCVLSYAQKAAQLLANGVHVNNLLEEKPWFL
ncbi:MAG: Piwi domain-containing protein [Candidatus Odinarchaeota archaeon]